MARLRTAVLLLVALVIAVLGATGPSVPAHAEDPPDVIEDPVRVEATPEVDGTPVDLDASVFHTDDSSPRPAVVLAHGFGGSKADNAALARDLAAEGYVVLTFTARGFGDSGGLVHLNHPDFEGADAALLVDHLAARDDVATDGDDPAVGVAGASYGGAFAVLAAGLDDRVDAIAPAFTYHSLAQALFPQYATEQPPQSPAGLVPTDEPGVFKKSWAARFFLAAGGGGPDPCGRFTPDLCRGYIAAAETGEPPPELLDLLAESDLGPLAAEIEAPTLLVQGEADTLFPLDHADATLRALPADTPRRMAWVDGGHDAAIEPSELIDELTAWFDRHLAHGAETPAPDEPGYTVEVSRSSQVQSDAEPEVRSAAAYPTADQPTRTLPLSGDAQPVVLPPGGSPAAVTSLPGGAVPGAYPLAVLPGQSATFDTAPLTDPLTLAGGGSVTLEVTPQDPEVTLFVSLWDLGSGGDDTVARDAVLPGSAVAPVHLTGLTPGRAARVQVTLPPVVRQVPTDHRLRLVVSSTDQAYATPTRSTSMRIGLAEPELVLPEFPTAGSPAPVVDVPWRLLLAVVGLALVAGLTALLAGLRRRAHAPSAELVDVPLHVEGLVKTYGDGFRAVDGVSLRAGPGQVVGLLGPNGAGKTTTMRMLVGLIRPDAGEVRVHGERVTAGAPVLASVGGLIEGPGFLPHLTGRQNLTAYWSATGRPTEEAQLGRALAIAGLGTAVDRQVRRYSQGMRQRLGIAQAMLGMPDLLLLDEPTNGLDPPQITAMRTVLAEYAATGRTVVVSSHLLAEVQQTCSHVVVMDRGKVVLTGSVAELTASDEATLLELAEPADPEAAADLLRALGLRVTPLDHIRLRVEGEVPRPEFLAALVEAGFAIDTVDGHRQLEEVFLGLVHPADAGEEP
ncbi:MAG: alpha/beta fold hydrolase [Propionibacteriaceae bacterium]